MSMLKLAIFYIFLINFPGNGIAQSIDTIEDVCRHFQGRVLGQMNGAPYRATCAEIRRLHANAGAFIPHPFFAEFRQVIRRERANDFRVVIANDPILRRACRGGRSRNQVSCELPLGAPNTLIFSLNSQNLVEKVTITIDKIVLNPALQNQAEQSNISNATTDLVFMLMNIAIIHMRAMSYPDELYTISGSNIMYELWPWRSW